MTPERQRRFFVADGNDDSYVVAEQVRDPCIFSEHGLVRDRPTRAST